MPFYEYQCSNCGHLFEELQSITAQPLTKCPNCGEETLKRLISAGAGLIFKGSGFYLTDYKKQSPDTSAKKETNTDTKTETKTETKKESKTEIKTDVKKPAKTETKKASASDK